MRAILSRCVVAMGIFWMFPLSEAAPAAGSSDTFYVRVGGSNSHNGKSPDKPFATIQYAVQQCVKSGGGYTIYVGPGTYNERVRITNSISPAPASGATAAPNRIVGDTSGEHTGDVGGSVVISGGGTQLYGVEVNARNYWELDGLTFSGQTTASVNLMSAAGVNVRNCTFNVASTPAFAIYSESYNSTIAGNTITFSSESGHGIYLRCQNAGSYTVERNRVWMTGADYLRTNYRVTPSLGTTYGIHATVTSPTLLMTISISNNIVTDRHTGCFLDVYSLLPTTMATVSANTIVGCTYPINASVNGLALGSVVNNVAASSYYGGAISMPLGTVSGLLVHDMQVGLSSTALVQTGIITGQDPRFLSPSSGNFGVASGSPVIDAGALLSGPAVDHMGRNRPVDGNNDLLALPDLGAIEYGAPSGLRILAWNQQDQRLVPRVKLPVIIPIKVGHIKVP